MHWDNSRPNKMRIDVKKAGGSSEVKRALPLQLDYRFHVAATAKVGGSKPSSSYWFIISHVITLFPHMFENAAPVCNLKNFHNILARFLGLSGKFAAFVPNKKKVYNPEFLLNIYQGWTATKGWLLNFL